MRSVNLNFMKPNNSFWLSSTYLPSIPWPWPHKKCTTGYWFNIPCPCGEKPVKLLTHKNCVFSFSLQTSLTCGITVPLPKCSQRKKTNSGLTSLKKKKNYSQRGFSPWILLLVKIDFFFTMLIINKSLYSNSPKHPW